MLLKKCKHSYGGELMKTRDGRRGPRPIDTKNTMHLVLRSSKAKKHWSFLRQENKHKIQAIIDKFANKYGVQILSLANVGNHLHFHIKLTTRFGYKPFIRAITSAIAMAITKKSRWNKIEEKFWDFRPFTRIVFGRDGFKRIQDYIKINQLQVCNGRAMAEIMVRGDQLFGWVPIN